MPKAYLVAHIRVHDKEAFEKFKAMSGPAIADHGGRVLVRNPSPDHREGDLRGITRHSPDDIRIQGNRITVPPPRELHPVGSRPIVDRRARMTP